MRFPKTIRSCLAVLALAPVIGCQTQRADRVSEHNLLEADMAFARAAEVEGVAQAFRDYAAPQGMIFPQGANPVTGRDKIFQLMQQNRGALTWTPRGADISRAGDLGYTWGEYQFHEGTTNAPSPVHYGKYLTIWKRQPDGEWRFVADIGNPSPPPD